MSGEAVDPDTTELPDGPGSDSTNDRTVAPGKYTWKEFMREHGHGDEIEAVYQDVGSEQTWDSLVPFKRRTSRPVPEKDDWEGVKFDPAAYLGYPPDTVRRRIRRAAERGTEFDYAFRRWIDETPVTKGEYSWEHFKWEYYYDEAGQPPREEDGTVEPFDPEQTLGFDPADVESVLAAGARSADELLELEDRRTVDVNPELDEDEFFSTADGQTTLVNRYDLEKSVSMTEKRHFVEEERYWVNKPYACVVIFHSTKENEKKYYVIEPYLNEIETDLIDFFSGKLRTSIKYSDDDAVVNGTDEDRAELLEDEATWLMDRYNLRDSETSEEYSAGTLLERMSEIDGGDVLDGLRGLEQDDIVTELKRFRRGNVLESVKQLVRQLEQPEESTERPTGLDGISARPEPAVLEEDPGWLTEYQVEKVLHRIRRDFIGYERIDGIKHDINVEDISCDGYNSPAFVYHTDYENLITNVEHGEAQLDNFVIKLAQRSGKGISKRQPQVDATLPDGSRAQLTLGREVSDHGTNYTIRQFKDVPFTPIDLINWKTFSLDEMAFLWLCIESNKSLIFAGGTASGKTTSLNAVSLFIPSNSKIVSIEDTREVELPQRNWVASVTRPSFSQDDVGDVDEFDLLEAALRQRPDYIVMGEIRGEEGRTLFQVMSTGHTTYTTFHADSVGEVLKRFTTEPINVSKTMFTALDLVSIQTATRVSGHKVRRNKTLTEINRYDAENDEINVQDVYQWQAETDKFLQMSDSNTLEEIKFDRGWNQQRVEDEIFTREAVLAYLLENGLNTYTQVAATFQAFINDPDTILTLMANEGLEESLEDLREMESVLIDIDPEKEEMVPRPDASDEILELTGGILEEAEERLFEQYRGEEAEDVAAALMVDQQSDVAAEPGDGEALRELVDESESEPETATESEGGADGETDVAGETGTASESTVDRADTEPTIDRDDESDTDWGDDATAADWDHGLGGDWNNDGAAADLGDDGLDADGDDAEAATDWGNERGTGWNDEATADGTNTEATPAEIDSDSILDETDIEFTATGTDPSNTEDGSSTDAGTGSGSFGAEDTADSFNTDDTTDSFGSEGSADSFGAEDATDPFDTDDRSDPFDTDEQAGSADTDGTDAESPSQSEGSNGDDGPPEDERTPDAGVANGGTEPSDPTGDGIDTDEEEGTDEAADDETTDDDPVDTGWDFGDVEGTE